MSKTGTIEDEKGGAKSSTYSWIPTVLGVYAFLGGTISLLGWMLDKQHLARWFGGITIQPNTALAGALAGVGLLLLASGRTRLAAIPGSIAGLIGLLTLLQYFFGIDLGIDTILMFGREWGRAATTAPGRMGFPAAVSWVLLGIAFLCALGSSRLRQSAAIIGILVALISALSLIGYVFGADTLYTLPAITAIAAQTATFVLAVSLGVVTSIRDAEPMLTLRAPTGAGLLARRALPGILLTPVVVGYLRQKGEALGLYDTQFGTALRTSVEIALFTALLWWTVRTVRHHETEIEAAGESLARSERDLADFFDNASVGLHWVGPDGNILRVNQAELDLLGYTRDEYIGRHISDFHVSQPTIDDILERLARGEVLEDYPAQMRHKSGRVLDVLINSSVLFDDSREFIHTRCFTRDVTEQKQAEEALREADQRKDEFLATLAHELRNPLAPISNSLQLIKLADVEPKVAAEARDVAERQVDHMVRLIDDLMDLGRITRNRLELRKERIDLGSVVKSVAETCREMIEKNGHELNLSLPARTVTVEADPVRITQIVTNLLNNASKFTERGGRIAVSVETDDDRALIRFKDSGIGIPKEMLDRVFEMFTQVDRSLERTRSGLGIGLSLTKRLVELHGGEISASSEGPAMGSEFVVELPLAVGMEAEVEAEPAAADTDADTSKRRILVVDDNADSAASLAMLLKIHGNDTQVASDGAEAFAKASDYKPDVIILDIGMPGMNGYETCKLIRSEDWGKDVLVIAMTGWGQDEDRRRSAEAGFDFHMVKPIDHSKLLALLADDPANQNGSAPTSAGAAGRE
jgi:PAS domain S-box-containing protein